MTKTNAFGVQVSIRQHRSSFTGKLANVFIVSLKAANGVSTRTFNNVNAAKKFANEVASYNGSCQVAF